MTTVAHLAERRSMRAGALPQSDERRNCRLSHEVLADLIQAGTHRRNALAANHTFTPMERDFAARYNKPRALFWRAVIVAYAVAAAAIYYYLCNH